MIFPRTGSACLIATAICLSDFASPVAAETRTPSQVGPTRTPITEDTGGELVGPLGLGRGGERTVGPGTNCDFDNLQTAINNAIDGEVLRLADGLDHSNNSYAIVFTGPSFTIRGGYPDCDPASSPSGRTTINVNGGISPVFDIWFDGAGDARQIDLENLRIEGSNGSNAAGVLVEGRVGQLQVNLRNVEVMNNQRTGGSTSHGAGLIVRTTNDAIGSVPLATVDNDSIIASNITDGHGGGIYCESAHDNGASTVLRLGTTLVMENQANSGGGIAVNGCRNVYLYNGGPVLLGLIPTGGFIFNEATLNGGAIYVIGGGEVYLRAQAVAGFGDPDHAALVLGNSAQSGGAATVLGADSVLHVEDAYIENNTADIGGGAFRIITNGELFVRRAAGSGRCAPETAENGLVTRPPCSMVRGNSSDYDGAFSITGSGSADVSRTIIEGNSATFAGEAQFAHVGATNDDGDDSELRVESSLITGHDGVLMVMENNSQLDLRFSTIAGNVGGVMARMRPGAQRTANFSARTGILHHSSTLFQVQGDGAVSMSADCVISNQPGTEFTSSFAFAQIDPQFANPDNGDFQLAYTSPAIDFCDGFNAPQFPDLHGVTRGQEWTGPQLDPRPSLPVSGFYDLGAYEAVWRGDVIFSDRLEMP